MVKKIAYCSIYIAIIATMSFVPFIGYISIGPVAITIIPIAVVIATLHMGFIGALTSSLAMGVCSLIASFVFGDPLQAFYWPDISVLPRFLMGMGVYLICRIIGKMNLWKASIVGILGAFLNTLFVTAFLFLHNEFHKINLPGDFIWWIYAIYINALVEISVTGVASSVIWPLVKILRTTRNPEKNSFTEW